jgi:ABC-type multidrug transport system fused ATPase/permease subunit
MNRKEIIHQFVTSRKGLLCLILISGILTSLLNVLIPLSIGKFYDLLDGGASSSAKGALFEKMGIHIGTMHGFLVFFFGLIVLRAFIGFIEHYSTEIIEEKLIHSLREKLFDKQMALTFASHHSKPVGKFLIRYGSELSAIRNYITKGGTKLISDIVFILFTFGVLMMMNVKLASIVLLIWLVSYFATRLLTRLLVTPSEEVRNKRAALLYFVETRLNFFFTVKAFNREVPEVNHFNRKNDQLYRATVSTIRIESLIQSLLPLLFFVSMGVVMVVVSEQGNLDTTPRSYLLVFMLLLLYMQGVFKRILRIPLAHQQGKIALDKVVEILNMPAEKREETEPNESESDSSLVVQNLSFGYTDQNALFKDLNLDFSRNGIYLITGTAGSGKSTLVKLLLKMEMPMAGNILLNGENFEKLSPFIIRKKITTVSDDAPLLGTTLFKALSYKQTDDKKPKVLQVLKSLEFPGKGIEIDLELRVSDGASKMNSSDRKKLEFARAFLTRKPILLLDDPFNGINEDTFKILIGQLNKLKVKRTIIITSREIPAGLEIDKKYEL